MEQKKRRGQATARAAAGPGDAGPKSRKIGALLTLAGSVALIATFLVSMAPPAPLRWMDSDVVRAFLALAIALEVVAAMFLAWGVDSDET